MDECWKSIQLYIWWEYVVVWEYMDESIELYTFECLHMYVCMYINICEYIGKSV